MSEQPLKVMLVEDSPSDAQLLRDSLQEAVANGMVIAQADCLQEALERLQRECFDVLLLDLHLPDSTGPDTFIRARTAAPHLPIVLFTGMDDESLGTQALHWGIQDYLVKGEVDGRQILRAIRYAIERKRAEDALGASEKFTGLTNLQFQYRGRSLERVSDRWPGSRGRDGPTGVGRSARKSTARHGISIVPNRAKCGFSGQRTGRCTDRRRWTRSATSSARFRKRRK